MYDKMRKRNQKLKRLSVKIRRDQYEYLKDNEKLNFSGFVREMIDKYIIKEGDEK